MEAQDTIRSKTGYRWTRPPTSRFILKDKLVEVPERYMLSQMAIRATWSRTILKILLSRYDRRFTLKCTMIDLLNVDSIEIPVNHTMKELPLHVLG